MIYWNWLVILLLVLHQVVATVLTYGLLILLILHLLHLLTGLIS